VIDGIEHLKSTNRLEILPYVTGGFQRIPVDDGDPLNKQFGCGAISGSISKYGLGPAFTAVGDAQTPISARVEADPSERQPVGQRAVLRREANRSSSRQRSVQAADRQR